MIVKSSSENSFITIEIQAMVKISPCISVGKVIQRVYFESRIWEEAEHNRESGGSILHFRDDNTELEVRWEPVISERNISGANQQSLIIKIEVPRDS